MTMYVIVRQFQHCDEAPEANSVTIVGVASELERAKTLALDAANTEKAHAPRHGSDCRHVSSQLAVG
jgi:hypothetical protein